MGLTALCKRVMGLDVHQAQISACATSHASASLRAGWTENSPHKAGREFIEIRVANRRRAARQAPRTGS